LSRWATSILAASPDLSDPEAFDNIDDMIGKYSNSSSVDYYLGLPPLTLRYFYPELPQAP